MQENLTNHDAARTENIPYLFGRTWLDTLLSTRQVSMETAGQPKARSRKHGQAPRQLLHGGR